jgi:ATP phosphoribosyltransferase regulatory subunit HisZ
MRVGREALARVPEAAREDVREALAKKDRATLASALRAAGVGGATRELLLALVRLYGDGGRYDDLLGRFGAPRPATGFAIDVENLEWAIAARENGAPRYAVPLRIACFGEDADRVASVAHALRSQGVRVSVLPTKSRKSAAAFAAAWGHDAIVHVAEDGTIEARTAVGARRALDPHDPAQVRALAAWTRGALP